MVPDASIIVFKPSDKNFLNVKFKLRGEWVKRSTPFKPGQEAQASAHGLKLIAGEAAKANPTVREWSKRWLDKRDIQDVDNDRSRLALHILPAIGGTKLEEVQPADVVGIVEALKAADKAPRTIRNVYSVLKAMYRDARIAGVCKNDPCILTKRQLGKLRDRDLGWRQHAVFSRGELELLLGSPLVPLDRRVQYGLLAVAMLRDGEACGLRWGDILKPKGSLARIVVRRSYERDTTKTETERWMPVHPVLHSLLTEWKAAWPEMMGRAYEADDLVLPCPKPTNKGPRKPLGAMRDKNWIWKRAQKDLESLGLRPRRVHDLRRTGISLYRADGAIEDILKRGSHAPPKSVMGLYTGVEWEVLCREVSKLKLTPRAKLEETAEELVKFRRVLPKRAMVPGTNGDQAQKQRSPRNQGASEWRRRESNPGPKDFQ